METLEKQYQRVPSEKQLRSTDYGRLELFTRSQRRFHIFLINISLESTRIPANSENNRTKKMLRSTSFRVDMTAILAYQN